MGAFAGQPNETACSSSIHTGLRDYAAKIRKCSFRMNFDIMFLKGSSGTYFPVSRQMESMFRNDSQYIRNIRTSPDFKRVKLSLTRL